MTNPYTLLYREDKGSPLSIPEMDDNLRYLNYQSLVKSSVISTVNIGAIQAGDTVNLNASLNDFVTQLLVKTYQPTFIDPSFSLSNNAGSLREVGEVVNVELTFNYTKGSILGAVISGAWNPNYLQNYRAGDATSYTINGTTQGGNYLNVINYTTVQGNNTFSGSVTYNAGPQGYDSDGNPYGSPYTAGTSSSQSTSFEGVYPIFATTSSIGSLTKQGLYSMLNPPSDGIEVDLVAETGGNKQKIDLPNLWIISKPLTKVEYFNVVSGQFDPTNKISDFSVSSVTEIVQGNPVAYKRYTNSSLDRGSIKVKLFF